LIWFFIFILAIFVGLGSAARLSYVPPSRTSAIYTKSKPPANRIRPARPSLYGTARRQPRGGAPTNDATSRETGVAAMSIERRSSLTRSRSGAARPPTKRRHSTYEQILHDDIVTDSDESGTLQMGRGLVAL
jgi:hypothetical protein